MEEMKKIKTINFNEFNYPVNVLVNPLMFGSYLKYKYEYYILFTFNFCFTETSGNNFSVPLCEVSKFFKETIKASDLQKALDNINRYCDFLGFRVVYNKDNYSLEFSITDCEKIMEYYSKFPSVYLHKDDFKNISKFNVYTIKLYLYLKHTPQTSFSINELKKLFGVHNSDYYSDFRRFNEKIFKKSIYMLNKISPTVYRFKKDKEGYISKVAIIRKEVV